MNTIVPPEMPVGEKSGNQPSALSMKPWTGLKNGLKVIRPQRP